MLDIFQVFTLVALPSRHSSSQLIITYIFTHSLNKFCKVGAFYKRWLQFARPSRVMHLIFNSIYDSPTKFIAAIIIPLSSSAFKFDFWLSFSALAIGAEPSIQTQSFVMGCIF